MTSEMATMEQRITSQMFQQLRSEIGTFRSQMAAMEQRLISKMRTIPSESRQCQRKVSLEPFEVK